jgi:hypothetical protein
MAGRVIPVATALWSALLARLQEKPLDKFSLVFEL